MQHKKPLPAFRGKRTMALANNYSIVTLCATVLWMSCEPIAQSAATVSGNQAPTWHPLYGAAKADVVSPPKTLHAGIEENRKLSFGVVLIKDNGDFPKNFLGVPFPVVAAPPRARLVESAPRPAPTFKRMDPAIETSMLSGKVQQELLKGKAEDASESPIQLQAGKPTADEQPQKQADVEQLRVPRPQIEQSTAPTVGVSDVPARGDGRELQSSQYQPGWMSYQTSSQTTHHQVDYDSQQSDSQLTEQQSTQIQTSKNVRSQNSSSRSSKSVHLRMPHSFQFGGFSRGVGGLSMKGFGGLGGLSMKGFSGFGMHFGGLSMGMGRLNWNLWGTVDMAVSRGIAKVDMAVSKRISKVDMAVSKRIGKIDMAVSQRVGKIDMAISKRVTTVTNKIATHVDRTARKAGAFGYDTTQWTISKVWHPGSWQQTTPNQTEPTTTIAEVPPQDNLQQAPNTNVGVDTTQPVADQVATQPADQAMSEPANQVVTEPINQVPTEPGNPENNVPAPSEPVAMHAETAIGTFPIPEPQLVTASPNTAPPIDVDWDPWYRNLLVQSCANWSSLESQPGTVDLLVTVRRDGKIACKPGTGAMTLPHEQTLTASQDGDAPVNAPAMVLRAATAVNSLSEALATQFPADTMRRTVSFEVVFVSTAHDVPDYLDACAPDIEHVVKIGSIEGAPLDMVNERISKMTHLRLCCNSC